MKTLSPIQLWTMRLGGLLLMAGAVLWLEVRSIAPWLTLGGALLFGAMQVLQRYDGHSFVIRRLRRQQIIGALCFVAGGLMMVGGEFGWPYCEGTNWLIPLLAGGIFELYTTFRLAAELDKE